MIDDLRPEPYFLDINNMFFNTCISCGMSHVLKPVDYCRACAGTWDLPAYKEEYLEVTEDTLDDAVYQSERERGYYEQLLRKLKPGQRLVAFYAQDSWQTIIVHKMLHLPTVMNNLFQALGHK